MTKGVIAFLKRLTTDQDFKTLVQHDPNTAFSQFSLSPAEQATLSAYTMNPEGFRSAASPKPNEQAQGFWS